MPDPKVESERSEERPAIEGSPELKEQKEEQVMQAAEILENSPEGSFLIGLHTFIAWVKNLVAPNDKT